MKRSGFLKTLAALVVSPSIALSLEEKRVPKKQLQHNSNKPNVNHLSVRYYCDTTKFKIMDVVVTDIGDKGLVVSVNSAGGFIDIRPIIYGYFRFNDLSKISKANNGHWEQKLK